MASHGQPPRVVSCVSLTISEDTNSYEVNADHGSWAADGFCRVLPEKELNAGEPYTMEVETDECDWIWWSELWTPWSVVQRY
ncbi:hypothetical protein OS493_020112 [Desmophyllum pertusum]|uniref:Uncharacterized protein n=1 Tax=Desmophyllum pertusum TaxID=174260 RepID=A0A9X0A3U7_9CNID|nr:hypothetical protein OS493_020112 [Desmophyllum pertusum]